MPEYNAVYNRNKMPNDIAGLISGINDQNLNYGSNPLLDLEKRMSKQDITAGLQKGLNFGIPQIAQMQNQNPIQNANMVTLPNGRLTPQAQPQTQPQATQGYGTQPAISAGVSAQRPKLLMGLQDMINGARENANTPFDISNWEQTQTSDNRPKGLAYRLGEGLGTAGRVANSPLGRGVGTGLLVAMGGGDPTQAMTYGLQAGVGNYENVQQDKMNRNLLQQQGIDTSGMRGYLNNDMAKSYTDNYYKLNNASYRNKKLDQDTYVKLKSQYNDQLKTGVLSPQQYEENMKSLNDKFVEDQITTAQTGSVQTSNQTNKTNSSIKVDTARIQKMKTDSAQNAQRIKLMEKRIAQGGATSSQRQQLNALKIRQYELTNAILEGDGGDDSDPLTQEMIRRGLI